MAREMGGEREREGNKAEKWVEGERKRESAYKESWLRETVKK